MAARAAFFSLIALTASGGITSGDLGSLVTRYRVLGGGAS
jgi:hypothetical protein